MVDVVASVFATDPDRVVQRARMATLAGADWIELRLDRWPIDESLVDVLGGIRLPVLVACRTKRDGGGFAGTIADRRALLERAIEAGAAGVDVEDWETWTPRPGRGLRVVVRSHHNFTGVTSDLPDLRDRLLATGATHAKIAVTAHDLADAAPVLDLMAATDHDRSPTIAFAMGRTAAPTRVLSALLGAPFVYGSIADGEATAPGQIPVSELLGLYDVKSFGPSTSLFGLLGNPALQSSGPWLHNRALRRLGVQGVYLPFETSRPEAVLAMLPRRRLRGMSVTAPFKQTMVAACHRLEGAAAEIGAVNTLTFDAGGIVVGHNTDHAGVLLPLQRARASLPPEPPGAKAAVLGAGGAARAAVLALRELHYDVTILARTLDGIRDFAKRHECRLAACRADVLHALDPVVVVHATPVGGLADPTQRLLPEWQPRRGTLVFDMVYRPRTTRLLRDVLTAGGRVVRGEEMFLAQAAAQIERFVGRTLPEAELRLFLPAS